MVGEFHQCHEKRYRDRMETVSSPSNIQQVYIYTTFRLQDESFPTPEAEILAKRASYETANDLLRYFQEILVLVAEPRSYTPYFYFLLNHGKLSWIITILSDVISWNETNLSVRACKMISEILSHLRSLEMGEIFKNEPQSTSKLDESLVQTFYLHTIKILINSLTQQPKNTTILLQLIVGLHEFRLDKFNHVLTTQYGVNPDQLKVIHIIYIENSQLMQRRNLTMKCNTDKRRCPKRNNLRNSWNPMEYVTCL